MNDLTGQNIKGYELLERIGAGGFGAVYRAHQSTVEREVAIKVILPGFANQPDFIRRFEAEAQLVARLEHPFITPLYDFWRDPEGAYLVMRYLRGGSLRGALQDGPFKARVAGAVLDQVSSALAAAHRSNVVHRDLKPANILLDEDDNAYLADFGIAKDVARNQASITQPDSIVGSPDYLAPEQARSETVTPRTDIYSLGVVLYEMLAGEHPFPTSSSVERLFKHLNEPLPKIMTLQGQNAAAINSVIQRATAKDPAHRYEDVLQLAAAYRQAVGQENPQDEDVVALLTWREQEVLQCLINGLSNREIAQQLYITVGTVKWYITQIYKKLGVRGRVQAVVRARELNLVVSAETTTVGNMTQVSGLIALPEPANPYKGLHAFQTADSQDFFGREVLVKRLVARLNERAPKARFLAVVGPSGSGKSSLVKAGLIPALWRGELPGSEKWFVVEMLPGSQPLDELEVALTRVAADQSANLEAHLRRDERGLIRAAHLILPHDESEMVVIIDQFEEVFTLLEDDAQRKHFLALLYSAVTEQRSRVRVVVTLRADYYDRPLQYPAFGELVRTRMETVLPLSAEGLEQAIVEPATRQGVQFEAGLVASISDEVRYQPGALPLLQYALTELFERREGRMLTHAVYRAIGGTVGALAQRADALYLEQDETSRELLRQAFLRMVTLGEGTEDTRRRVERAELLGLARDADRMDEIIDLYTASRLLSVDHDPATRTPTVEVAHEAILREWERLRGWLAESREDIRQERLVAQAAAAWVAYERDASYLLSGSRLEQAAAWQETTGLILTPVVREFIQACIAEGEAQRSAEDARQQREAAQQQRVRALLRALVAVFALAAVVSGLLAISATGERNRAEDAEQDALRQASIGLAAQAVLEIESGAPERAVLLALEALEYYPYTGQAESALAQAVEAYVPFVALEGSPGRVTDALWSADGTQLVTVGDGIVTIWDAATSEMVSTFNEFGSSLDDDLALTRDGTRIFTASASLNVVQVWDAATGERLLTYEGHTGPVNTVTLTGDGSLVLTCSADGTAQVWDARTGERIQTLDGQGEALTDARWSPDEDRIVTASERGTVRIWEVSSGQELRFFAAHAGGVLAVDWSPDGTLLATSGRDGLARLWDAASGEALTNLVGHVGEVRDVAWSPDGQQLATVGADKTAVIWDARTGTVLLMLLGLTGDLKTVAWSPDGQRLVTGGGIAPRVWDVSDVPLQLVGHTQPILYDAQWSPDVSLIATTGPTEYVRIWDAITGQPGVVFDVHEHAELGSGAWWFSWSPAGDRLVTAGGDNIARVWDPRTGEEFLALPHLEDFMWQADWSPDGTRIVTGAVTLKVWDAQTGDEVLAFGQGRPCMWQDPAWSPDGTLIVTGCILGEGGPVVWDATTGEALVEFTGHTQTAHRPHWSPDGTRIVTPSLDTTARIWDAVTGEEYQVFTGHNEIVWDAEWSPDGERIASVDEAGIARVWNASDGVEVYQFSVAGGALNAAWSPDGEYLIVSGLFSVPAIRRVWQNTEALVDYARSCCVQGALTTAERLQFGLPER